ncbi:ATP-binding protein [Fulvimarina sp. MAC3]|uniref:ATP-binding protein n=1 Tax=Fulvimarina sp. MAC3 TaxID=3148887 RepID=UPI0031FCA44F
MISLPIQEESQVGAARRTALQIGEGVGLAEADLDRLAIVVTEACTNLVRHASDGELLLDGIGSEKSPCVKVIAVDQGPGIASVEAAMVDGFTTSGETDRGIGGGLGSMKRQADRFDIFSAPQGTTVVATIGAQKKVPAKTLDVAGVIVPKPGFTSGGDAWAMRREKDRTVIMLMDVLGHGPTAARDGESGREAFEEAGKRPLEEIEAFVSEAMTGSRGAAALFVEIPHAEGRLRALGLGNVRGDIVMPSGQRHGIASQPGIVGAGSRRPRIGEYDWTEDAILILSTDGLKTASKVQEPGALYYRGADIIAATLYKLKRRGSDDAGIVVARSRA